MLQRAVLQQGMQFLVLRNAEAQVPISEAAFHATALAEHPALVVARVRQNMLVVELPHVGLFTFDYLQKAAVGCVQQYLRNVHLPVAGAGLVEQHRQFRGGKRHEGPTLVDEVIQAYGNDKEIERQLPVRILVQPAGLKVINRSQPRYQTTS